MTIRILPPQLANQIAAGEVVERPASVVKELVENCIDAGATRIDIEIVKGGSKLIRIKDNGAGIPKSDLALALSRHATSKVQSLDDLEAIMSFGFRGEALASISSVSRLTLTSKTDQQSEAWQAYAEGSEMAVKVIPAAHPIGTSIEVADLFFNTPARRRFLKSDKTEFTHIDDWLKRIAIVKPKVHFTLSHNNKIVRNYRPAHTETQYQQRLGQICGKTFSSEAIKVECDHDGMLLKGFIQAPETGLGTNNVNFFYVNGRLVRDRLVNHAVRQAFSDFNCAELANYVLMFSLDPHQVDVNVHPAKHEVRFHQSRYVHDYILQALQSALSQLAEAETSNDEVNIKNNKYLNSGIDIVSRTSDDKSTFFSDDKNDSKVNENTCELHNAEGKKQVAQSSSRLLDYSSKENNLNRRGFGHDVEEENNYNKSRSRESSYKPVSLDRLAVKGYQQLMNTFNAESKYSKSLQQSNKFITGTSSNDSIAMPSLLDGRFWLIVNDDVISLLSLKTVEKILIKYEILDSLKDGLISQPLLMPVSIKLEKVWHEVIHKRADLLVKLGIELTIRYEQLIIKKVPPYLRESPLAVVIADFLNWIEQAMPTDMALAIWLSEHMMYSQSAIKIWQLFQSQQQNIQQEIYATGFSLPWQLWVKEHFSDQ